MDDGVRQALTICQPYAHLIATGKKFIENRDWPTTHRGWLVIHAGKGKKYMVDGDEERYPDMVFGAAVAVAWLVACVRIDGLPTAIEAHPQYGWVPNHKHNNGGPWLWLLSRAYRLDPPVIMKGQRKLFGVGRALVGQIRKAIVKPPHRMPSV